MSYSTITVLRSAAIFTFIFLYGQVFASGYWQQRVEYGMDVYLDVETHRFHGTQDLQYFNHSPDTITRVFYHLYWNAFQPGSVMDMRSRALPDPDFRLDMIRFLKPADQGMLHATALKQDGAIVEMTERGTILEVTLAAPLLPGASTLLQMHFEGQVPLQIRRSGRNNTEGIAYSMTQWFPKLCAYDDEGWHPNPYVGREFYGSFGDFDVRITIDSRYIVAASGILQNAEEIGYGYAESAFDKKPKKRPDTHTWHFIANDVHDFAWAADTQYTHTTLKRDDGVILRFMYIETPENAEAWKALPAIMDRAMSFINERYGQYPYPTYAFVQGGDGGMEYPMLTLITGNRSLRSLVSVSVHELLHSWYQMVLGINESLHAWMDEGFTNYTQAKVMDYLTNEGFIPKVGGMQHHMAGAYSSYRQLVASGREEPLTTHADHYESNTAYGVAAYSKGSLFLEQLGYIIGDDVTERVLHRFFNEWKFRHPKPQDFVRIAEKESGLVLDWYYQYWVMTTKTINYAISEVSPSGEYSDVVISRRGTMPMPVELVVTDHAGSTLKYDIPLDLMRGVKARPSSESWKVAEPWQWTNTTYMLKVPLAYDKIAKVEIDPSGKLADVNPAGRVFKPGT